MTDRELLEKAAKAAGLKASEHDGVIYAGFGSREWNPLNDDGDALRLATTMQLAFNVDAGWCEAFGEAPAPICREPATPDPYAATRRCIVRAAASIGETP